jgi:hypothetical protein
MEKSVILKKFLTKETLQKLCEICRVSENIIDASEKSICSTRDMIDKMSQIEESLGNNPEPTSFIYMERIAHSLRVNIKC